MNKEIIGSRIKYARERKKITQEELAQISRIHVKSISNYESGKSFPPLKTLFHLSRILKVPPEFFITIDPNINITARLYMIQSTLESLQKEIDQIKEIIKINK